MIDKSKNERWLLNRINEYLEENKRIEPELLKAIEDVRKQLIMIIRSKS